ncbi:MULTISPECIES: FAD binding domain-containing protein [unclassified Streptomyces]|uniref:FAD binding domain-containing protein n=1 Tax=unclassified Streptomyces TaxID=2593676 RepID=UPI003717DA43
MQLRLPTSVSEAREYLAEGAIPVGGATLVWAAWQRDGFPEQAVSLRRVPEATVIGDGVLGGAVLLHQVDDRVPEVLRLAAKGVGTGAVRRAATVGGNIAGSSLRDLLPAALVLDARADVLTTDGVEEVDLAEVQAKSPVLLALRWREPVRGAYAKVADAGGGEVPTLAAAAVDTEGVLRVAVREGYVVSAGSVGAGGGGLEELFAGALSEVSESVRELVRGLVSGVLGE